MHDGTQNRRPDALRVEGGHPDACFGVVRSFGQKENPACLHRTLHNVFAAPAAEKNLLAVYGVSGAGSSASAGCRAGSRRFTGLSSAAGQILPRS